MKRILFILLIPIIFAGCEILADLSLPQTASSEPTREEVAEGLKEALRVGVRNTVSNVSATNGFYRNPEIFIPFPEEAQRVKEISEAAGLSRQVREFEEKLNRAAELASQRATDIFIDAIRQMTIRDAIAILQGSEDEATQYLKRTSQRRLYSEFYPVVENATDQINLARYWNPLAERYNTVITISGGTPVDTDLNNYVTEKAIEGIFVMLAKEEAKIRKNPADRVTEILRKVFGSNLNPYN